MICPRCNSNLLVSSTQGIEIDFCSNCRGVWLDRGELEKIIERSNQHSNLYTEHNEHIGNSDSHHFKDEYHSYNHHSKRRKGFLSDLFDF